MIQILSFAIDCRFKNCYFLTKFGRYGLRPVTNVGLSVTHLALAVVGLYSYPF